MFWLQLWGLGADGKIGVEDIATPFSTIELARAQAAALVEIRTFHWGKVSGFKIFDEAKESLRKANSMPKAPKGEKRSVEVTGNVVHAMKISAGEIEEDLPAPEKQGKDPAAVSMGKRGGRARALAMTPERRAEIAKLAAAKRWSKH